MARSKFRLSLILAAAFGAALPGRAAAVENAGIIVVGDLAEEASTALASGLKALKRVFGLKSQGEAVISHAIAVSSREATLELELAAGGSRSVALRGGQVYVNGESVGRYAPGGALDRAWRKLLSDAAEMDTPALVRAVQGFRVARVAGEDARSVSRITDFGQDLSAAPARVQAATEAAQAAAQRAESLAGGLAIRFADLERLDAVSQRLEALDAVGAEVAEAVRNSPMRIGDVTVAAGQTVDGNLVVYQGDVQVFGHVTGHVVSIFGDVTAYRGGTIDRNAVSVGGAVLEEGGTIRGDIKTVAADDLDTHVSVVVGPDRRAPARGAAVRSAWQRVTSDTLNVVAAFAALAMLGFGSVFFGRRYVEIIADTASHSFGRSLVTGMLGQLLVLPTFAMLIVGLVFTVVGILLLPFAAIGYVVLAVLAAVGGYLAVAHAIGETFTRRRMAHGAFVRAPNAYGYLFTGLVGLLGLWALAALTGWLGPVAVLFKIAAGIVTWLAATVGFGAVLLSRGGLRDTFSGRHLGDQTDEYLWATPPATPTAARMGMRD